MKKTKISLYKNLYKSKDVPYTLTLESIFHRIKDGKSKETIEKVRAAENKQLADKLKLSLPCIMFSGLFKERTSKGLVEHSGLMPVDYDGFPDFKTMDYHYKEKKKNKHFLSLFISPRGKGLKGVVKIPKCNAIDHAKYFKEFNKQFPCDYWDKSNSNVDRVCFESYDPDIYVNWDAIVFAPELKDEGYSVTEKIPLSPLKDEMEIIDKIMSFSWSKDFVDGERNAFVFDLAGMFCEYGVSKDTAIGYIFNNVCMFSLDFTENEARKTINSAYRVRDFGTKYFENYSKIKRIKNDLSKGKDFVKKKYEISDDVYNDIKQELEIDDFWFRNEKNKIKISSLKYKIFLESNGFKKYYPNGSDKPTFVKVESNKVEVTSTSRIKDFVLDYLSELKEYEVWEYCANFQNLFSEHYLLMINSIELMILNDSANKSYIAFRNGILEVSKNQIELKDYIDVNGYIWKSHIIDRDWVRFDDFENDYSKFIYNISDKTPLPLQTVIGYLISTYKNRSNNKAIILNDEIITPNPEGGTGKGLFMQGIAQIRKTHIIDGKTHNDNSNFQNQSVSIDDKILVFDDVHKNFNFENQFSLITEGITIRHLYKDPIKLRVQDSPKIVISTNYAIKGEGNSHDRRRHEVEVSQYYGHKLTPEDDFGRELFNDWVDDDYGRFYNYIVHCLQLYLKNGLIKQTAKNLKLRKLIAETSIEFIEWVEDGTYIPHNTRNDKKEFYNKFTDDYSDFKKWLNQRTFTKWVDKYCKYKGFEYKKGNSNGMQWFEIGSDEPKKESEVEF